MLQLLPEIRDFRLRMFEPAAESAEFETLGLLAAFILRLHPQVVVECGSYRGVGATYMGRALKANGDGHLWSIEKDPELANVAKKRIEFEGLDEYVTIVEGDTLKTEEVPRGPYGLVFHDGDRTADALKKELERFSGNNLVMGGFSFVHDSSIGWDHVAPLCEAFAKEHSLNYMRIDSGRGLEMLQR